MPATKVCETHGHLEVTQVLDAFTVWTDAILTCTACGQPLLAQMIDRNQHVRAYRVAALEAAATQQTLRDISRGSCDLERASSELAHLANRGERLDTILLVDHEAQQRWLALPADITLPTDSWRELDCDGALIEKLLRV